MVEPARFTPEELDRIEDALEGLEGWDVVEDPSPQVRDVLESYRGLLVASREALPMEEVPQGALAAVFAEARTATAEPTEVNSPAEEKKPGFFARLRRSFLVPSLALAGTAALVLWIARPQDSESLIDQPVTASSNADDKATAALGKKQDEAPPPSAEPAATPVEAAKAEEAEEAEEEIPADDAEPAVEAEPEDIPAAARQQAAPPSPAQAAPGKMDDLGEVPKVDQKAKNAPPEPDPDKPAWNLIERGDRSRQDGDCAAARSDYLVATEDDDPKVRARAYAGLGLCQELAGDDAGATDAFERARGQDAGVDKYIQAERNPSGTYKPTEKKRRKAKKSAPRKPSPKAKVNSADQSMFDPFAP